MLRLELEGYGGLFAILEAQRESLLGQDLDAIMGSNNDLQKQADAIQVLRERRMAFINECSQLISWEAPQSATIKALVRLAPDKLQPMFDGLIKEIERLMNSSRNYLKRNQMLMRRAYDVNRQFLSIVGSGGTRNIAYRRNGALETPQNHAIASSYLARA
jgi:hypothetical protein